MDSKIGGTGWYYQYQTVLMCNGQSNGCWDTEILQLHDIMAFLTGVKTGKGGMNPGQVGTSFVKHRI